MLFIEDLVCFSFNSNYSSLHFGSASLPESLWRGKFLAQLSSTQTGLEKQLPCSLINDALESEDIVRNMNAGSSLGCAATGREATGARQ